MIHTHILSRLLRCERRESRSSNSAKTFIYIMGGVFTESLDSCILEHITNSPHFLLQGKRNNTLSVVVYIWILPWRYFIVSLQKINSWCLWYSKNGLVKPITIISIFVEQFLFSSLEFSTYYIYLNVEFEWNIFDFLLNSVSLKELLLFWLAVRILHYYIIIEHKRGFDHNIYYKWKFS